MLGPDRGRGVHRRAPASLRRGDALLLYTDGLVETPQRDIALGIDRLLGQAERLLRGGFDGGAARLVDPLESTDDDRALVLRPPPLSGRSRLDAARAGAWSG